MIAAIAAPLHFYRLSEPRAVVFDELYLGRFVNAYTTTGEYSFGLHPPHARLVIAGVLRLGGYRGDQKYYSVGWPITQVSPALLRLVPALAGTLVPLLAFTLLIQLGASDFAALIGGLALALDNALLLETRILVIDGVLLAASLAALCAALAGLRAKHGRIAWMLAAGAFAGLAVGTKLPALAVVALIGLCGIATWLRDRRWAVLRRRIADGAAFAASALAVYAGGWWLHFALLTGPGVGESWAPRRTGDWIADTLRAHASMWNENVGLTAGHDHASAWWSWPLMMRPVGYLVNVDGGLLVLLGNPVVWWGSTLGLLAIFASGAWRASTRGVPDQPPQLWIPLSGWALCYLPLAGVPRVLFLYHYLSPLVFAVCAVALWLDRIGLARPGDARAQPLRAWALLAALALGFASISPFTLSYVKAPAYQRAVLALFFPGWL